MLRTDLERQTIIRGRNNAYYHHNETPGLSIKTMSNGEAFYHIDGGHFAVGDSAYLILNADQPYTIEIQSATIIESFCVFFPTGWAEDVMRSSVTSTDHLLDMPEQRGGPLWFFERLYPHDSLVTPLMARMRTTIKNGPVSEGWLEEALRQLLVALLQMQFNIYREIERMPGARRATRLELYRRLYRARDFMHASFTEPLSLERIAGAVYLSPYHFLRAFKAVFGCTPHTYLTQRRLERAQFLLTRTDLPVTDICFAVGFESPGSFSTLFQRHFGHSPRRYRQQIAAQP